MKVILLRDVAKVGRRFEIKEVADGYARNFIISRGMGWPATNSNLKKLEALKIAKAGATTDLRQFAGAVEKLATGPLRLQVKASATGQLFAGIGKPEIVKLAEEQAGVDLDPEWLMLERPLKHIGEHRITLRNKTASGGGGEMVLLLEAL